MFKILKNGAFKLIILNGHTGWKGKNPEYNLSQQKHQILTSNISNSFSLHHDFILDDQYDLVKECLDWSCV